MKNKIQCSVESCIHNQCQCCTADCIKVGCDHCHCAENIHETLCSTFEKKK